MFDQTNPNCLPHFRRDVASEIDPAEIAPADKIKISAEILEEIFIFLTDNFNRNLTFDSIGRRVIAVLWRMRPDLLPEPSLEKIAKRMGGTRAALSLYTVAFDDYFDVNFRNRNKKIREAAKLSHPKK